MKTTTTLMTAILAALVLGEAAQADPVVIGNPSFEAPVVGTNLRGFDSPTTEVTLADWSIRDDSTSIRSAYLDGRTTTVPQPTDGVQMVLLGYSGNGNTMAIYQTAVVPAPLAANTTYTLTFDVANRGSQTDALNTLSEVMAFFSLDGTDVTLDSSIVGSHYQKAVRDITPGTWDLNQTATFTTGTTDLNHSLNIVLKVKTLSTHTAWWSMWDNVRLEASTSSTPGTLIYGK